MLPKKTKSETKKNIYEYPQQENDQPTDESIVLETIGTEESQQPIQPCNRSHSSQLGRIFVILPTIDRISIPMGNLVHWRHFPKLLIFLFTLSLIFFQIYGISD